ncbi:MAG: DUF262 domain-containing protein [Oscillospiraceae bacterium]
MSEQLISLGERFNKSIFRIPDYQRGYAWGKSQLTDFWEDLINLRDDAFHYTGMLSISKVQKKDYSNWIEDKWLIENAGYSAYYVVDGQQRLTTCIILINEILNLALENNHHAINNVSLEEIRSTYISKTSADKMFNTYLFGYQTDNPSFKCLRYEILGESNAPDLGKTFYTQNLFSAKVFFSTHLKAYNTKYGFQFIERLFKKLTTNLKFNVHEISDGFDVFVAFETMNNRGKKLSNLELLKNRLIYLTTLFPKDALDENSQNSLRNQINDSWKEIYKKLGRKKDRLLNDDEYLRNHWILYFTYSRSKGEDYFNFLLKQKFTQQNIYDEKIISSSENNEYEEIEYEDDDSLQTGLLSEEVQTNKLTPQEIKDYVLSLQFYAKYWYYSYYPVDADFISKEEKMWIEKLNKVGINYFRPLVTVIISKNTSIELNEVKIELLKAIERFIFINFRLGMYQASYKSSQMYARAKQLMNDEIDFDTVSEELNNYTNENLEDATSKFKSRIQKFYKNYEGYYSWRDIRYFLYEYEFSHYLNTGIPKLDDSEYFAKGEKDRVSIEHIYPQTPEHWSWKNKFRNYTNEECRILTHSLGNLLPLSQSINSSLQNFDFDHKKTRYLVGSHSEVELQRYNEWTPYTIYQRGMKLLDFMNSRWKLCLNDDYKKDILALEFVNDGRISVEEIPYFEITEKKKRNPSDKYKKTNRSEPIQLDEYLENKDERLVIIFLKIKEFIVSQCKESEEYVLPQYITYKMNGKNFVEMCIQKSNIRIMTLTPMEQFDMGTKVPDTYLWVLNYRTYISQDEDAERLLGIIYDSYLQRANTSK